MAKRHKRANKRSPIETEAQRLLSEWRTDLVREDIENAHREVLRQEIFGPDKIGDRAWIAWAREAIKNDEDKGKLPAWLDDVERRHKIREEEFAADRRVKDGNTWPMNDYVLGAALLLIAAIVLIGIALVTGLVKP